MRYILCIFVLLSSLALAHPDGGRDHTHAPEEPISKKQAQERASKVVAKKVKAGKLNKSWTAIEPTKIYQKDFGHGPEWVVEFHDPKVTDKAKDTVYVFIGLKGKVFGINFTGE